MQARLISHEEHQNGLFLYSSVEEAAKRLGVAETTIRRAARAAGAKRLAGRTIRGFVAFDRSPVPVSIAYAE